MKKIIDMLKSMTNSKKKVFALALATCIIVLSIASSSIAYFTDTATYTNTFTSGNVSISLTVNGTDVDTTRSYTASSVSPGDSFNRETVITIGDGSDEAFFGAIITVKDTNGAFTANTVYTIFTGLKGNADRVVKVNAISGGYEIFVAFTGEYYKTGTAEATVFSSIDIPGTWNNDQMTKFSGVEIDVTAYAVQTVGLNGDGQGAEYALGAAFAEWQNYANATVVNLAK